MKTNGARARSWSTAAATMTILSITILVAAGCRATSPVEAPTAESSVRPGINERYLDPGLDVDRAVAQFEVESREIYSERHDVVAALDLEPGMDVVDIGAGTGLFMEPFASAIAPDGTLYAVDIAPPFVRHLHERAARLGLANVEARLCSEDSIDLPAESVDLAFLCDTYHHFEYPMSSLASIRSALRPGGELVVIDFIREPGVSRPWVLGHVRAGQDVFRSEIEAAGFEYVEDVTIPGFRENYVMRFRRP